MHLPPDVVRAMDYEDVLTLHELMVMQGERMREQMQPKSPGKRVSKLKKR